MRHNNNPASHGVKGEDWRGHASRDQFLSSVSAMATQSGVGAIDPTGPEFFHEGDESRRKLHHTRDVGFHVRWDRPHSLWQFACLQVNGRSRRARR
jgi:hypothetical protein